MKHSKELNTNKVFVCGTLFHVFISTLKNISDKQNTGNSLLVINDHTPKLVDLAKKLVSEGYFTDYCYIPFFRINEKYKSELSFFKKNINRNKHIINYVEAGSTIKEHIEFIKKSNIYLFYYLGFSSVYFLVRFKKNSFIQLEDGLRNYHQRVNVLKAFKRKYILNTPQGEGRDPQIKHIEVQFPEKLPSIVRHKGVKLDIKELVSSLGDEGQNNLLRIFSQDKIIVPKGDHNLLLITQPLSEDKLITEDEKITIYNQILKQYAKGYQVYIKAHPRETTDYIKQIDMEIVEIPRDFPLEILNFYPNISFKKGVTIFSGALDNLNNIEERVFLGRDNYPQLTLKKAFM